MPTSQLILLAILGVGLLAWGVRRDIKNHKKEKETQPAQKNIEL